MKKLEMREVMVVRCDSCGCECVNYTTFQAGTPDEKDACTGWNADAQMRCEDKVRRDLAQATRGSAIPGAAPSHGGSDA